MAKKKKKREQPSGPPGAPEWVVTFTDMISLLVTFFVLLMTFSSLEEHDLLRVDALLSGRRGIHKSSAQVIPQFSDDDVISATDLLRGSMQPHSRSPDKLPESLEDMGQKITDEHLELDLERVTDGLVVEFGERASFLPGSGSVTSDLERSLREVGKVLRNYPHLVVVEGFTDSSFRSTAAYPSAHAMGFGRASAAADILLESGMTAELLQVASYGDQRPRATDATAEGRQLNRRVSLRVLSLSRTRATYLARNDREGGR